MSRAGQIAGHRDIRKPRADQCHRVAAGRHAGAGKVCFEAFKGIHARQGKEWLRRVRQP